MEPVVKNIPSQIILWGGSGQAKALRPIIEHHGSKVAAIFDDTPNLKSPFPDIDLFRGKEGFETWIAGRRGEEIGFCIAIGNPHGRVRLRLHDWLISEGLSPATVVHPTAWIEQSATLGAGTQVFAGAIVAIDAQIGRQCIINNHALVEHEAVLGDAVEVAPSATVLGLTSIGANSLIGANATVLSRLKIGSDVTVGAGAIVSRDVADNEIVSGETPRPV